jgi:hypothetical protein
MKEYEGRKEGRNEYDLVSPQRIFERPLEEQVNANRRHVSRNIPVQNSQSVGIFQDKIFGQ